MCVAARDSSIDNARDLVMCSLISVRICDACLCCFWSFSFVCLYFNIFLNKAVLLKKWDFNLCNIYPACNRLLAGLLLKFRFC